MAKKGGNVPPPLKKGGETEMVLICIQLAYVNLYVPLQIYKIEGNSASHHSGGDCDQQCLSLLRKSGAPLALSLASSAIWPPTNSLQDKVALRRVICQLLLYRKEKVPHPLTRLWLCLGLPDGHKKTSLTSLVLLIAVARQKPAGEAFHAMEMSAYCCRSVGTEGAVTGASLKATVPVPRWCSCTQASLALLVSVEPNWLGAQVL